MYNNTAIEDVIEHAFDEIYSEIIGIIVDGKYIKLENESFLDKMHTAVNTSSLLYYYYVQDKIDYIVHSHNNCSKFSDEDLEVAEAFEVPLLLVNIKSDNTYEVIIYNGNSHLQ